MDKHTFDYRVDNSSAVTFMEKVTRGHKSHKHWLITDDGDLRVTIEKMGAQHPAGTTTVKWIPGHATQELVDDGILTQQERVRHSAVDEDTREFAWNRYDSSAWNYVKFMWWRQRKYDAFISQVRNMMVNVSIAASNQFNALKRAGRFTTMRDTQRRGTRIQASYMTLQHGGALDRPLRGAM